MDGKGRGEKRGGLKSHGCCKQGKQNPPNLPSSLFCELEDWVSSTLVVLNIYGGGDKVRGWMRPCWQDPPMGLLPLNFLT